MNGADGDTRKVELHYDENNRQTDPTDPSAPESKGSVIFHMRDLTGRDHQFLNDNLVQQDKRGKQKWLGGTHAKQSLMRACVKIEGLQDENGKVLEKMTPQVYDTLPEWIISALQKDQSAVEETDEEFVGN